MNFPDFDDFIAELVNDDDSDDELCNPITQITLDENGNIKFSCLPDIVKTITMRCEHFSMTTLRKYHQWLSEQLSDNPKN